MTILDLMNANYTSFISITEVEEMANLVNGLNKLDEETWNAMREEMENRL